MGFSNWPQTAEDISSFIGVILGFIGVTLAIVFFLKSRRIKRPIYTIRSVHLIRDVSDRVDFLEIKYAGERIPNLTSSKITLWNQGRETIEGSDIAQADPLSIRTAKGLKILEARVLQSVNAANRLDVSKNVDDSGASIRFDFLDYGEGAVIQVLHTGSSSSDLSVTGTIKGGGQFRIKHLSQRRWFSSTTGIILCFFTPFLYLACVLSINYRLVEFPKSHAIIFQAVGIVTSWGMIAFTFIGYWGIALLNLWQRIPPGLELFDEES
jgi:hypothetical protein